MCCCGKPTINGEKNAYSWDGKTFVTRPVSPPALLPDDELVYDGPGRCGGLDSHCHHFRVVKGKHNCICLLVRHGLGDERIELGHRLPGLAAITSLDSTDCYWLLQMIYHSHKQAVRDAVYLEEQRYRQAFVEGRLKKKKRRGQDVYDVHIEPKAA